MKWNVMPDADIIVLQWWFKIKKGRIKEHFPDFLAKSIVWFTGKDTFLFKDIIWSTEKVSDIYCGVSVWERTTVGDITGSSMQAWETSWWT